MGSRHVLTAAIALLLVVAACDLRAEAAAATNKDSDKPWFCHDLDCPKYKKLDEFDDVELREYAPTKWASTVVKETSYDKAVRTGFWRLFKYISGENEDKAKIPMTAPVRVKITPSQGPFCEDDFVVSFFVPFEFQENTPKPSNEAVFLDSTPGGRYYVAAFGGFAKEAKVIARASELVEKLDKAKKKYVQGPYFEAGYDAPFRLINRHNEVWIPAAEAPSSQS